VNPSRLLSDVIHHPVRRLVDQSASESEQTAVGDAIAIVTSCHTEIAFEDKLGKGGRHERIH